MSLKSKIRQLFGLHEFNIYDRRTTELTDAEVHYGIIPKEDWYQPDSIDEEKATEARKKMMENSVIYGGSVP